MYCIIFDVVAEVFWKNWRASNRECWQSISHEMTPVSPYLQETHQQTPINQTNFISNQ